MKPLILSVTLFLAVLFSIVNPTRSQTVVKYGSFVATNANTTGNQLISTNLLCNTVTFYATRSNAVNSGIVYLGTSSNATLYPIAVSAEISISAPESGKKLNLSHFWIRNASSGDGVLVIYQ